MAHHVASFFAYAFYFTLSPHRQLAYGVTEFALASNEEYSCTNPDNEECILSCDVTGDGTTPFHFDCGDNPLVCLFYCNATKCIGSGGTVNATNAIMLYVIADADNCFEGATVYTPPSRTADFLIKKGISRGFHQITIEAGLHAMVYIECDSLVRNIENSEDCNGMTVNAQNAYRLVLDVGSTYDGGTIQCPPHSEIKIPCDIITWSGGTMRNVHITAANGIPSQLTLDGSADYNTITLHCDCGESVGPFDASSICWSSNCLPTSASPAVAPAQLSTPWILAIGSMAIVACFCICAVVFMLWLWKKRSIHGEQTFEQPESMDVNSAKQKELVVNSMDVQHNVVPTREDAGPGWDLSEMYMSFKESIRDRLSYAEGARRGNSQHGFGMIDTDDGRTKLHDVATTGNVIEEEDNSEDDCVDEDAPTYGKCTQMNCSCTIFIPNTSKWSKDKCKSCDHSDACHDIASQTKFM
eukprot:50514_1